MGKVATKKGKKVRKKRKFKTARKPKATEGIKPLTKSEWASIIPPRESYTANIHLGPGQPKVFETPEILLAAAEKYFQWCNDNPWYKNEWKSSGGFGQVESIPVGRPFTWSGLCIKLGVSEKYFNAFKINLIKDKHPRMAEYLNVIDIIGNIIHTQKFEGASIGAFNSNLIAYDLGLKKDVPMMMGGATALSITVVGETQNKTLDEVKQMLEAIDIEHEEVQEKKLLNGNVKINGNGKAH